MDQSLSALTLIGFGDHGWGGQFLRGTLLTLQVSMASYALGLSLGFFGALAKLSSRAAARFAANSYTNIIRAVPEILLIFLIYYMATSSVRDFAHWLGFSADLRLNGFAAAALSVGFVQGGFSTDVLRGAIIAVGRGQREAAFSVGLNRSQAFVLVILPQMMRHALPGLGNLWLIVLKESSLVSIIGVSDLLMVGKMAAGSTHNYLLFYAVVGLIYLAVSSVSAAAFAGLERYFSLEMGSRR